MITYLESMSLSEPYLKGLSRSLRSLTVSGLKSVKLLFNVVISALLYAEEH